MKYAIIVLLLARRHHQPGPCGQMLQCLRERRLLIRVPVMWIPIITAAFGAGAAAALCERSTVRRLHAGHREGE